MRTYPTVLYSLIKDIHVLTAVLSISGFVLRGIGMMQKARWLQQRWVKIAPHINDTLLLGSAITIAVLSGQYPGQQPWLTAKVIALLVYIGFGMMAFRFATSQRSRQIFWALALITAAYIVGTAITRTPTWPLISLGYFTEAS